MFGSTWPCPANRPLVLVISAPSGAGKSSLIRRVRAQDPRFVESVSATTRAPRPGERDGEHYFFLDEAEFLRRIAAGAFLEHAVVFGRNRYGTPRAFVEARLAEGRDVIMDVDVQGAASIRRTLPSAVQVFVTTPNRAELERRLRGRGTEDEATVQRRLAEAEAELAHAAVFDYLLINDQLDQAVADLTAIVRAERLANRPRVRQVDIP